MHARPRPRTLAAGLLATLSAASLLLTACGDPEATSSSTPTDRSVDATVALEESIEPAAKLRQAAERSAEFDTVTSEMTVTADGEQISRMVSQGAADGSRARMTLDMPGVGEMRVLVVDGTYFYGFPGLPDGIEWASMSIDDVAAMSGIDPRAAGAQDPTHSFDALSSISDEVETLGEEQVGGVDTTHYRFTTDAAALFDQAVESGTLGGAAAEAVEAFQGETVMDAWIDGDGLVRRLTYELSMDPSASGAGVPSTFAYELTFSDYGVPVEVTAPPPETTMSMQDMMGSAASMFGS